MQDATPIIAIRNAIPATGYPSARVCHPLSEGNDQKRRAPVDCSVIRSGGLGPINARTSRLGQLMTPPTCVAPRDIWCTPRPARFWALMTRCAGFHPFTQRALRSYGARWRFAHFLKAGGGSKSRKFARKGPDQRFCFR